MKSKRDIPLHRIYILRIYIVLSGDDVLCGMVYQGRNSKLGFRASTDGGATFGPITNLSNSNNADSVNAEISAGGGNIIVS